MEMTVKEVADLVGISVRTLHHYDSINLLKPDNTTEAGYRLYNDKSLEKLQQILFFKELDFPLKKIKEILNDPSFDTKEALRLHKEMLLEKRLRIDKMIETIDKTNLHLKGEINMTKEERFEGFDFSQNPYEQEAKEKWGEKTVDKANEQLANMPKQERLEKEDEMNTIFRELASVNDKEKSPASKEAQQLIQNWYDFLNDNINYEYSLEIFKGLGEMYVADERFTKNINRFGDGLAQFMHEAINIYVENHK